MASDELLSRMRTRQTADLHARFSALSERDIIQILCATPDRAVYILQQCYGWDAEDAKAVWNDYVLRCVDGHSTPGQMEISTCGNLHIQTCFGIYGTPHPYIPGPEVSVFPVPGPTGTP
ncbi:MAG: hypothetical protein U0X20_00680 [Caldilineaceae bacterium]